MKKIMLSLLAVAATLNVLAIDIDAKAKIELKGDGNAATYTLYLVESADLNAGWNNGYCSEIMDMNDYPNALYVQYNSKNYSSFGTKDLTATDIVLKAKLDGVSSSYTLTVSNVSGSKALKLMFGTKEVTLANGTYNLTATELAAASAIAIDTPKEFCFKYEKLTVNGYAGKTLKISKDGTDVVAEFTLGDTYEYDFSADAAGRYVVTFDGKEYQIDVKPSVTVVP